jgi:hypothetical protein
MIYINKYNQLFIKIRLIGLFASFHYLLPFYFYVRLQVLVLTYQYIIRFQMNLIHCQYVLVNHSS